MNDVCIGVVSMGAVVGQYFLQDFCRLSNENTQSKLGQLIWTRPALGPITLILLGVGRKRRITLIGMQ
jgi:hypothetical protein